MKDIRRRISNYLRLEIYIKLRNYSFKILRVSTSEVRFSNPRIQSRINSVDTKLCAIQNTLVHIPSGAVFLKYNKYENWTLLAESSVWNPLVTQGHHGLIPKHGSKHKSEDNIGVFSSTKNYFHWLLEDALQIMELANRGPLIFNGPLTKFQKEFASMMNIPLIESQENWIEPNSLLFAPRVGFNAQGWDEKVLDFSASVKKSIQLNEDTPKTLYISRAGSSRSIPNEEFLDEVLLKYDITKIQMEEMSLVNQINLFSNADTIIAAHGAALANLIWTKPNSRVLEIMNPNFYNNCYQEISVLFKLNYQSCDSYDVNEIRQHIVKFMEEKK